MGGGCWRHAGTRTLKAGLAPDSRRHLTAETQRLDAAICRAVPKSKSLQVASTSEKIPGNNQKKGEKVGQR